MKFILKLRLTMMIIFLVSLLMMMVHHNEKSSHYDANDNDIKKSLFDDHNFSLNKTNKPDRKVEEL